MAEVERKDWFRYWFDSPYYDLLYRERDQKEADMFVKKLVDFLKPAKNSFMLDLACGKGRHAIALSKMGFTVTGVDLSEKNITEAKKHEAGNLDFFVHDMRKPYMANYYDYIFNLFTSFGYFDNSRENSAIVNHIYNALKPSGVFVLDFVNIEKVSQCISDSEKKEIDGVQFLIKKSIVNGFLVKDIKVIDGAMHYDFEEKVHMFTAPLLKQTFEKHGFEVMNTFGDYTLNTFNTGTSDRLILICKKK